LLLQAAFEIRDSPVIWEEPSEQPVALESSIVIPLPMAILASGPREVPDFTVTNAWHKLAIEYIASIEILDTASAPSLNDVNLRRKKTVSFAVVKAREKPWAASESL
jgi:hypothetical protein